MNKLQYGSGFISKIRRDDQKITCAICHATLTRAPLQTKDQWFLAQENFINRHETCRKREKK